MPEVETSEKWQIEVSGTIYEAGFDELPSWIEEGSLQPTDKVRKGNLRWIEAAKVPAMMPLFAAKAKGLPLPNLVEGPVKANSPTDGSSEVPTLEREIDLPAAEASASPKVILQAAVDPDFCSNHPAQAAAFICSGCNGSFCRSCPRSYGGNVKICPNCGAMCRSVKEVRESSAAVDRKAAAIAEGFGFADFVKALSHPLRFKFSLIVGAIMFTAFSVGRSSSVIGGIEMIVASTFCSLLGNMLTFGVLANTLDNFSRGDLDENFMPAFEDFSMGDDVVHPFVLSAGAYISSFGAFAVVALIGFYMVSSAVDSKMNTLQADIEKIPGTQFYTAKDTVKQSDEVRNLLAETQSQNAERLKMQNDIANGNTNATAVDDESAEQEQLWREASEQRKAGLESVLGKTAETREREEREMFQSALGLPPVLVVIGALAFLWGLFYFPVACIIAGYNRTFSAVVNPLVGLDTIKRLGTTYIKMLLMGLSLLIVLVLVGTIADTVFASLAIPGFGNIPAKVVTGFVGFYLWVVFSCVIGYCLFKSSDRLHLNN